MTHVIHHQTVVVVNALNLIVKSLFADNDNARLVADDCLVMTSLDSLLLYSTLLADIVSSSSLEYVTILKKYKRNIEE